MASFFEKLKKGMGAKEPIVEKGETEETKTSLTVQTETPEEIIKEEVRKEWKVKKWPFFSREEEGQLAIDVYQTENDLVIQSAIAGVKPENLDISIERDIIIIKGGREKSTGENSDYFIRECFWGPFSREVILPVEVDPSRAKASFKEGILTIRMPKIEREKKRKINISA